MRCSHQSPPADPALTWPFSFAGSVFGLDHLDLISQIIWIAYQRLLCMLSSTWKKAYSIHQTWNSRLVHFWFVIRSVRPVSENIANMCRWLLWLAVVTSVIILITWSSFIYCILSIILRSYQSYHIHPQWSLLSVCQVLSAFWSFWVIMIICKIILDKNMPHFSLSLSYSLLLSFNPSLSLSLTLFYSLLLSLSLSYSLLLSLTLSHLRM